MQAMEQYPFIFSDEPRYRIRRHLAFWVFWWLTQGVLYSVIGYSGKPPYNLRLLDSMVESMAYMIAHISLAYALMYFVIPRFLLKQKYWLTALWVLICFLGAAGISVILSATIIPEIQQWILADIENGRALRLRATIRPHLALMAGLRGGITIGGIAASIKRCFQSRRTQPTIASAATSSRTRRIKGTIQAGNSTPSPEGLRGSEPIWNRESSLSSATTLLRKSREPRCCAFQITTMTLGRNQTDNPSRQPTPEDRCPSCSASAVRRGCVRRSAS